MGSVCPADVEPLLSAVWLPDAATYVADAGTADRAQAEYRGALARGEGPQGRLAFVALQLAYDSVELETAQVLTKHWDQVVSNIAEEICDSPVRTYLFWSRHCPVGHQLFDERSPMAAASKVLRAGFIGSRCRDRVRAFDLPEDVVPLLHDLVKETPNLAYCRVGCAAVLKRCEPGLGYATDALIADMRRQSAGGNLERILTWQ